jgi:hypothetical protein
VYTAPNLLIPVIACDRAGCGQVYTFRNVVCHNNPKICPRRPIESAQFDRDNL